MANEPCIHCGQPSEDGDRVTESGRVHERCWDAFSEEKPVAKSSVVAGCFGLSMAAGGAVVLSIGLAAFAMGSSLEGSQNPLVGIPVAIMWFMAMSVAFSAIPAGAIMLTIAFFIWVVTNNNAFKNSVAVGVAMTALAVFVVGPQVTSWFHSSGWSKTSSSNEAPNFSTKCKFTSSSTFQGEFHQGGLRCRGTAITWYQEGKKRSEVHYANPKSWSDTPENTQCIDMGKRRDRPQFLCEVKHGKETNWYESGQLTSEIYWVNNRRTGTVATWYESGQKSGEIEYVDDKRQGLSTAWYENGQKERECNYHGGFISGQCITWHKNSQKRSECTYTGRLANVANQNPVGVQTNWYENGQKSQELVRDKEYGQIIFSSSAFWDEAGGARRSNPDNVLLTCDPDDVCRPLCIRF
jgi:antitoxin component YwqK of YwqJK toxin-antitoxin module